MQIDRDLILRLENLAKLELSDTERVRLAGDLTNILTMVEKMKELDTTGVEPLVYISEVENAMREDVVANQVDNASALFNTSHKHGPYFQVPKVM